MSEIGPTSDQIWALEVAVKNYTDPIIQQAIVKFNEAANDKHVIMVVTGGEAFNFYFKPNKVIETHDYDLRILPAPTKSMANNPERLHSLLLEAQQSFAQGLSDYLNRYGDEITNHVDGLISGFKVQRINNILVSVCYAIKDLDEVHFLVDIAIYFPGMSGMTLNDIGFPISGLQVPAGTLPGFIPNMIEPVFSEDTGVPYVKLGYLYWDTVKLINIAISQSKGQGGSDRFQKYGRYLSKYIYLLNALSDPESYLRCAPLSRYVRKCAEQMTHPSECEKMNPKEVIERGIKQGLFPSAVKEGEYANTFKTGYLCGRFEVEDTRKRYREAIKSAKISSPTSGTSAQIEDDPFGLKYLK
jgi:hypothetical protein